MRSPAGVRIGPIALANPLSAKFDTLRPSLLPGLVDAVAHNRRHGRDDVGLFEVGTRFSRAGETRAAAVAWTGSATPPHWSVGPRDGRLLRCQRRGRTAVRRARNRGRVANRRREPFLVPGQTASLVAADGTTLGVLGQVLPSVADGRGLPRQDRVFVAELNLDRLSAPPGGCGRGDPAAAALSVRGPRFVDRGRRHLACRDHSWHHSCGRRPRRPRRWSASTFFDRYQGKGIAEGSVSLSMRMTFQALDRTLTDADVQASVETILAALVREHEAVQR